MEEIRLWMGGGGGGGGGGGYERGGHACRLA